MLTAALLIHLWRIAVVRPPVFRPEQIAMVTAGQELYRSKVNQGRDKAR